jgi:phosphoglycolate phosphatase
MIRVVVFDFDGTLVQSNHVKEACSGRVVAHLPGGAAAVAAARRGGGNRYQVYREVARRLDPDGDPERIETHARELAAAYTRCCARGIIAARERRGALAAVSRLKRRGFRIWINSATPWRDLPDLVRRRGLARYLDGALGGPASKIDNLRRVLAAEGVAGRDVVMVGDSPDDREAARAVGTWFVAITAEQRIPERPRYHMPDLTKLVPLLDRLSPRRMPAARAGR